MDFTVCDLETSIVRRPGPELGCRSLPPSRKNLSRLYLTTRGYAVAQLVEALRYKPEGRGFDSRWCNWNFSMT